jgi:hypothetical protein
LIIFKDEVLAHNYFLPDVPDAETKRQGSTEELNKGFFLPQKEVVLALSLLLHRWAAAHTMEGRRSDLAMIREITV